MDNKVVKYLNDLGIDLLANIHPFSKEYLIFSSVNNQNLKDCIDHLISLFVIDLELIKRHNLNDFEFYKKKISKNDISFWGIRFELFTYSKLIQKLDKNNFEIKRGKDGMNADIIVSFEGKSIQIETTAALYSDDSSKTDPISKIMKRILIKENKPYSGKFTCLLIDINNLLFYRQLSNNFRISITELCSNLESKFGAILFHFTENIKTLDNLHFVSSAYDWFNPDIDPNLNRFLKNILEYKDQKQGEVIKLKYF